MSKKKPPGRIEFYIAARSYAQTVVDILDYLIDPKTKYPEGRPLAAIRNPEGICKISIGKYQNMIQKLIWGSSKMPTNLDVNDQSSTSFQGKEQSLSDIVAKE